MFDADRLEGRECGRATCTPADRSIVPRRASLGVAAFLVLGALPARASADEPTAAPAAPSAKEGAEAEVLFFEGKQLMLAGKYAAACAKLAASERLDPAAGTLMNLADCYEKNGQLASAWVTFRDAATASERDGRTSW